jgi:hypothetical protein
MGACFASLDPDDHCACSPNRIAYGEEEGEAFDPAATTAECQLKALVTPTAVAGGMPP